MSTYPRWAIANIRYWVAMRASVARAAMACMAYASCWRWARLGGAIRTLIRIIVCIGYLFGFGGSYGYRHGHNVIFCFLFGFTVNADPFTIVLSWPTFHFLPPLGLGLGFGLGLFRVVPCPAIVEPPMYSVFSIRPGLLLHGFSRRPI